MVILEPGTELESEYTAKLSHGPGGGGGGLTNHIEDVVSRTE